MLDFYIVITQIIKHIRNTSITARETCPAYSVFNTRYAVVNGGDEADSGNVVLQVNH